MPRNRKHKKEPVWQGKHAIAGSEPLMVMPQAALGEHPADYFVRMGKKKWDKHYHYTSMDGAEAIKTSGRMLPSTSASGYTKDDMRFGEGIYATKLDPHSHTRGQIAYNNYDGSFSKNGTKTQRYIEVTAPTDMVENHCHRGRDVYKLDTKQPMTVLPQRVVEEQAKYWLGGQGQGALGSGSGSFPSRQPGLTWR
eukprot:gnl/TRDRNA2_/TRDRNA2_30645_c0_seq1.p1 gnl/TRDRNA2_/TRDRNA2_30645_c0~~gnl/TRDRNA2_/TRDRNA2_30645_c0_seq1.p1  ORF type:complete len:195 (+),score=31.22 gnl/TRDRNA2_/TRDRNA2_30645_c0_seq1:143-727(+)